MLEIVVVSGEGFALPLAFRLVAYPGVTAGSCLMVDGAEVAVAVFCGGEEAGAIWAGVGTGVWWVW